MRAWELARSGLFCGLCGASIPKDAPVQLISQIGLTRVLRRCQACAEGTCDGSSLAVMSPSRGQAREGVGTRPVYEWTSAVELARALERRR